MAIQRSYDNKSLLLIYGKTICKDSWFTIIVFIPKQGGSLSNNFT